MTRARVLPLIVAFLIGGAAAIVAGRAPEVRPAAAYVGVDHVDCGQSWPYSQRVCYDTSSGWFHIYTTRPYQQPNLSFPSNTGYAGSGLYIGQIGIYNVTNNSCNDEAQWNGGLYIRITRSWGNCSNAFVGYIVNGPYYDGPNLIGIYGDNFRFLVWYLSTVGYDFVITR